MALLEAHHLHKRFGDRVVLEDVTLAFEAGRVSGIMGPNGEAQIFEDGEDVPRGWKDHPFEEPAEAPPEPETTFANEQVFHAPAATTEPPKTRRRKRRK